MKTHLETLPGYYTGETFSLTFTACKAGSDTTQPEMPYALDEYGIEATLSTTPLGPRLRGTDEPKPGDGTQTFTIVRREPHLFAVEVPATQSARLAPGTLHVRLTLTHRTSGAVRMGSCTPLVLHSPASGRALQREEREPRTVMIFNDADCHIGLYFSDRLGIDGRSAYEVAAAEGFTGTEPEYAALPIEAAAQARDAAQEAQAAAQTATTAAQEAAQAAVGLDDRLAGKADLSAAGTLEAVQLAPLEGRQTGAITRAGSFTGSDPTLLRVAGTTLELLFRLGDDVEATQYVFSIRSGGVIQYGIQIKRGNLICCYGNNNTSTPAQPNGTYHILFANTEAGTTLTINGISMELNAIAPISPQTFILGVLASDYFRGTIYACRLWGHTFTPQEASTCWNAGQPALRLHPSAGTDCLAEFLPCGLLPDRWRDTSASGCDLTGKGTIAFDFAPIPNLREIVLESGIITGDITAGTTLRIPAGYRPVELVVRNGNPAALTGMALSWNNRQLTIPAEIPGKSVLCQTLTGTLLDVPKETNLRMKAAGGGKEGVNLQVRCRWYGE